MGSNRLALCIVATVCGLTAGRSLADQPAEGTLAASDVRAGAVVLEYRADAAGTVTGFYTRLANCVGPRQEPVVVGLRADGELLEQRVAIPVYGTPLNMYTRAEGGHVFPPLDVGQEYRVALPAPLALAPGETVSLEVVSSEPLVSGVTAGLQFAGTWPLLGMREPFRVTKSAGPVSRVEWSAREVVCTGNQQQFDPLCAPQNNSGVVSDSDGTLYQFTSYYSVDEQYGGGRAGSFARIYGYRRGAGEAEWQPLGLIADPVPDGLTYCGDPFAFRDLEGRPCLVYTTVDGTNGFVDWKKIDARVIQSETESFAGPWGPPHSLFEGLPEHRVNCLRIYPRQRTGDYVIVWLDGSEDITNRGVVVPSLDVTLTHDEVLGAVVLTRNQEEGGGGFVRGDKGYLSTWQIPNINDTTSIQRLYEFDLHDALNPEAWSVVPCSWGLNDGTNAVEDGGATADAWSLSYLPGTDMLWASSVVWSASRNLNSTLACSVPWERRLGETFRFGCPLTRPEIAPVVEYAVGETCGLSASISAAGAGAIIRLCLAPSDRPLLVGGIGLEIADRGAALVAYSASGEAVTLAGPQGEPLVPGQWYRVDLRRDGAAVTGWVDGRMVGSVTVSEPEQLGFLAEPQRFKLYARQGCLHGVRDAVLVDGPPAG